MFWIVFLLLFQPQAPILLKTLCLALLSSVLNGLSKRWVKLITRLDIGLTLFKVG